MSWRKQELLAIIERIPVGVAITRPDGRISYANPCFCTLIGARLRDITGTSLRRWLAGDPPATGTSREAADAPACLSLNSARGGGELLHLAEAVFPLRATPRGACQVHVVQDLRQQKKLERLAHLAFYDHLTGLPNRNLLADRLARAMVAADRHGSGFAVLYIDIDRFKHINDTLGHDAGDEVLRQFAQRLSSSVRAADTVARCGGDEFVVLLEGIARPQAAARVMRKLLAACSAPYEIGDGVPGVTASMGASLYPRDGRDGPTLLRRADQAMYSVKKSGRNGYLFTAEPLADYCAARESNPA